MKFNLREFKYQKSKFYKAKLKFYIFNFLKFLKKEKKYKWPVFPSEEIKNLRIAQEKNLIDKENITDGWGDEKALIWRWNLSETKHYKPEDQDQTAWLNGKNGFIVNKLKPVIKKYKLSKCFNFGCLHPLADFTLAKSLTKTNFFGFDRSKMIFQLNNKKFRRKNLKFGHGDLFKNLSKQNNIDLFFHAKTTMFCYPAFINKLYKFLAKKKVKYIAIFEWLGFSVESSSFYYLTNETKRSKVLRDNIFAHNYPNILSTNGYEIIDGSLSKIPMKKLYQQDVHLCYLLSKLKL